MERARVIEQLREAHAQWRHGGDDPAPLRVAAPLTLSTSRAEDLLARAERLVGASHEPGERTGDSALIVTKAPHAGSDASVSAIVARCLAFGVSVERVVRKSAAQAEDVAHALYPDVWLNFARLPSGRGAWGRLAELFDTDEYAAIFGVPYDVSAVVTGRQACMDNELTHDELIEIWQTGREPLRREVAAGTYGAKAADLLCARADTYDWYRGPRAIGIQKVNSGMMAFALRHPRLYGGRPVIVLNGHFALLSQRFRGPGGRGAAVIELGLGARPDIRTIRHRLVGAADVPGECLPGTIRRDASDGHFDTDEPGTPVTAWANVVHASDGYLAGAIETATVLRDGDGSRLQRSLRDQGYDRAEIEQLVLSDPVVVLHDDEQRLTKRTAWMTRDECLATIRQFFPPLEGFGHPRGSRFPMVELLAGPPSGVTDGALDPGRARPEPSSRPPRQPPPDTTALPPELADAGRALLESGGAGLLVPLAGSGGRFGGYHLPEGHSARLKPLLSAFHLGDSTVSALDVRAAHARYLRRAAGAEVRLLLSCSHVTEPHVRAWCDQNGDLDAAVVRVPEMYRVRLDGRGANAGAPDATAADDILRDLDGHPLLKPSGSLGLLVAAAESGTLRRWAKAGVQVAVAANSDDVGFRVDRRILGLLATEPELDAVVLTTPARGADGEGRPERGGFLRERQAGGGWSAYIEEHGRPSERPGADHLSTNQIYFRIDALERAMALSEETGAEALRRRLPLYFEVKRVQVGTEEVRALHAYQTYGDVLRALPSVRALTMSREPRAGQPGAYAPLKSPGDIDDGQRVLEGIAALGDELLLGGTST